MGIDDQMRKAADEVSGRAKEMWGDLTDNERLEAEGRAQHTADDAGHVADHELDPARADRITDDVYDRPVGDDAPYLGGEDSNLRDEIRDDMGQDPRRHDRGTDPTDGNLRDALRDDMGQRDPLTDPNAIRRDQI